MNTGTTAIWGYSDGSVFRKSKFDSKEWNQASGGLKLAKPTTVANNSAALLAQLTDGTVYFEGANVNSVLGGRAKLFAPSPWQPGSSNSHFDETAFPTGGVNSPMTPGLANGESMPRPGAADPRSLSRHRLDHQLSS